MPPFWKGDSTSLTQSQPTFEGLKLTDAWNLWSQSRAWPKAFESLQMPSWVDWPVLLWLSWIGQGRRLIRCSDPMSMDGWGRARGLVPGATPCKHCTGTISGWPGQARKDKWSTLTSTRQPSQPLQEYLASSSHWNDRSRAGALGGLSTQSRLQVLPRSTPQQSSVPSLASERAGLDSSHPLIGPRWKSQHYVFVSLGLIMIPSAWSWIK